MHFRTSNDALQALSGKRVAHPGLVFSASANGASRSLRVWAFRRRGRPRADTALYQAPFLNVSQGGSVCLGSTDAPYTAAASDAPAWTAAFFASAFTHVHGQPVNGRGPSYAALLSELADSGDRFPGDRLVPAKLHLRHVLG
jgi:PRTRC genetic system protein B